MLPDDSEGEQARPDLLRPGAAAAAALRVVHSGQLRSAESKNGHILSLASDTNGTWHTAIEVPGTGTLNKGGGAGVLSVSCASPGNCAAAGSYTDCSGHTQAFVASQT
jgi:hypothetical protein